RRTERAEQYLARLVRLDAARAERRLDPGADLVLEGSSARGDVVDRLVVAGGGGLRGDLPERAIERAEDAVLDAVREPLAEVLEAPLVVLLPPLARGATMRLGRGCPLGLGLGRGRDRHALDLQLVDALRLVEALQLPLAEREHGHAVR